MAVGAKLRCTHIGVVWLWCASTCYSSRCTKVITFAYVVSATCHRVLSTDLCILVLVNGEQSCAQGFQPWEMVAATDDTGRNRQFIVPSLNFSCGGVISNWVLRRGSRNVGGANIIVLQLWREREAGSESTYILQTEQTHTARTRNAATYFFQATPSMTVAPGDVFGCYVPSGNGLRMGTVAGMPMHTVFRSNNPASHMEFTAGNAVFNESPLITINFSKSLHYMMITCSGEL